MLTKPQAKPEKRIFRNEISPKLMVAVIGAFSVLVIGLFWHFLSAPSGQKPRILPANAPAITPETINWVADLARDSQGDFNKLSAQDQKRLTAQYGDEGAKKILISVWQVKYVSGKLSR